jgi:DNA polymerase-3 subunit alpha
MPHADFVHLRVHSAYSLSEGALKIKDLISLCKAERMPAVAVTDTGNLFGAMEFGPAALAAGIQPITGAQIGIRREDGETRNAATSPPPDQLVLLAQNAEGCANLLHLLSKSFLDTPPGDLAQVSLADLESSAAGLIALSGGPAGAIGRLLGEEQMDAATAMTDRLAAMFDGRFYIELMRHGLPLEDRIEPGLLDLAYEKGLPLVATNEAFFADRGMYEAHDALLCIAGGAYVSQADRRRLTPEHYFKPAAEMRALFADLPEALDNTLVVAQRCACMPESRDPILPVYTKLGGRTEIEALRELAAQGLERRLEAQLFADGMDAAARAGTATPYRERLEYELGIIEQMGFPGYFLIVADFIQWTKDQDIPVGPGRGSGAGSVVAWALTITDLDPLRWGLLFERFLNPERVSMPDFDIDFCMDRRDEVLDYVQREYGEDRVAQIITFGKLQARAVLRDVGRVLELPYGLVDRICKLVPNNPASPVTLSQAIAGEPALQQIRDEDESVARMIAIALRLEGLYRHASTHAAGVVIGDRPLEQLVPLYRDPRSTMPVTQYNMKYVEQAGLVKFDFLGLKTLTVLARAVDLLAGRGVEIDIGALPLDDKKTFEMLSHGDTTGVFQLESSGMRDVLRKLRLDRFEDIIAVVALYRPGPMENIPSYIKRKHGEEAPDYLHPSLEPILTETYGIMIYQEQVMQIAQTLSGYSLGAADLLRRAMGKKNQAEMDAQRNDFVEGAVANGVAKAQAGRIFDQVDKFAGYGFNKSHAAAYALVAWQTAYLKANYPVEFMAALMTIEQGNTDKIGMLRAELERIGVPLLPPDVNRSGASFTVEANPLPNPSPASGRGARTPSPENSPSPLRGGGDGEGGDTPKFEGGDTPKFEGGDAPMVEGGADPDTPTAAIRYALAAVRNVGAAAMAALVEERAANGPFADLMDFANRLDARQVNKRALENLAAAGAFECLGVNRHQAWAALEVVMRHAALAQSERESNQDNLFGGADAGADLAPTIPERPEWPVEEKLTREFAALGFYLSAHPMESHRKLCDRLGVAQYRDVVSGAVRGERVKLAGIVGARRLTTSSRGARMAFVQMSDASGSFEVTIFSEVLAGARELLEAGKPLIVTVEAQRREDDIRLTALKVELLDDAATHAAAGLRIFLADAAAVDNLAAVFKQHGARGRGRVSLVLDAGDREVEMEVGQSYAISPAMRGAIKSIPGIVDVQDL